MKRGKVCSAAALLCALLGCGPLWAAEAQKTITSGPGEVTELWTGKVLTATFRAGMCFGADGKARGVLILRHANGQEDPYHLYGSIRANAFDLTHSSGHSFTGRITGPRTMEGRVKLKNGLALNLEGERALDVPLAAPDCAPLNTPDGR